MSAHVMYHLTPEQAIELYNTIPGVRPVSRVPDRTTAHARLRMAMEKAGLSLVSQRGVASLVPADRKRGARKTIRLLIDYNPKIGKSRKRFALYRDGMTMEEYAALAGVSRSKAMRDLYDDRIHGYIALEE